LPIKKHRKLEQAAGNPKSDSFSSPVKILE